MKFARELDENLVPEWRSKYLDYKQGKRKIKELHRALAKAESSQAHPHTPWTAGFRDHKLPPKHVRRYSKSHATSSKVELLQPETSERDNDSVSIANSTFARPNRPPSLQLSKNELSKATGALLTSVPANNAADGRKTSARRRASITVRDITVADTASNFPKVLSPRHGQYSRHQHILTPVASMFERFREQTSVVRVFNGEGRETRAPFDGGMQHGAHWDFEDKEADFFLFLQEQLDKVETFYKAREDDAVNRLDVLKDQLYKMRLLLHQQSTDPKASAKDLGDGKGAATEVTIATVELSRSHTGLTEPGKASEDGRGYDSSSATNANNTTFSADRGRQDYVRRQREKQKELPYAKAQRLLKTALQDFYRGLELLKNYESLNREGFRKINKKYDKAVQARPVLQFFHKQVRPAHFVQSGTIETCIAQVEDLYTNYFSGGNRKIAVTKLRSRTQRAEDFSAAIFRNGALIAAGTVFAFEGLVYAEEMVFDTWSDHDELTRERGKYLLQLYGGFFLAILLFLFFCADAYIWTKSKINYSFIFEFDTRHNLDWKQLAEIPCLLYFLMGLSFFLTFIPHTPDSMFTYWPLILVSVSMIIVFLPIRTMYYNSRKWWAISNFRMATAGALFTVEFRDFFLGDMYCSLTYAFGNIELFFCLYANKWDKLAQCNASNSKTLGFLSALPAVWRALQSIRRYKDSKQAFPHLANLGKYMFSILFTMTLSLYRIYRWPGAFWAFFAFGMINSIYSSLWDIFMDWHLMDPNAGLLRKELGFRKRWVYYAAMIIDPVLRFNWVFFAIFPAHHQHSAVTQFMVAFSEVIRRGIWTIFRVENEHCTNVSKGRASKEAALPYKIEDPESKDLESKQTAAHSSSHDLSPVFAASVHNSSARVDVEHSAGVLSPNTIRRHHDGASQTVPHLDLSFHHALERLGEAIAHAQSEDFERRRRPQTIIGGELYGHEIGSQSTQESDEGFELDTLRKSLAYKDGFEREVDTLSIVSAAPSSASKLRRLE